MVPPLSTQQQQPQVPTHQPTQATPPQAVTIQEEEPVLKETQLVPEPEPVQSQDDSYTEDKQDILQDVQDNEPIISQEPPG